MRLFIAEKPSLATEIAKGLGSPVKKNGYLEIGDNIVTWAYGHVLQQVEPDVYDEKYKMWKMEDLPIIPIQWKLVVTDSCKAQFKVIKALIGQSAEIVNAGDPDREGQLLIDEILDYVGNVKPVKRILLNALDEKSVKTALNDLRNNEDFIGLKNSALARSRADWLVGMNLSRAFTIASRNAGHSKTLSIGRVKTPTMALVVKREKEIRNFKPKTFYQLKVDWKYENETINSVWQPNEEQLTLDEEHRLLDQSVAFNLLEKIKNKNAAVLNKEVNEKKEAQRLPYSLSALQIDAGRKFGYDPQTVLDTMQQLYEKKLTTYPRSDCDFLPENQLEDADFILNNIATIGGFLEKAVLGAAVKIKSRAWNDKKISAHHAIIPTTVKCNFDTLTEVQQNLYSLVALAYIAQFYPVHIYQATKLEIECINEIFTSTGKTIIRNGWKCLYQKEKDDSEDEPSLPNVEQGESVHFDNGNVAEKITIPPKRFTAATLLKAMKEIHKYVNNPDLKSQLKAISGIGTEATRAGIIDELQKRDFIRVEKKNLIPTKDAEMMVDILPDQITYPDTTAIWENQLERIVNNEISLSNFFEQQKSIVTNLVSLAKKTKIKESDDMIKCPVCEKGRLHFNTKFKFWGCSEYINGCKASFNDLKGKPNIIQCPTCKKGFLQKRKGPKGLFWGCSDYPNCKSTFEDSKGKPVLN